ncbi:MAG: DNA polymerase ligase N-terminal domain-containing protein [Vulcanimicrobiaceae bacterium]
MTKRVTSNPLKSYAAKRDFTQTPEPPPTKAAPKRRTRLHFVIQKHRASRLHYDFRLEADGVLKSWAVPKGPSLNPADKRLAIRTEDHPLEYGDFEGIIPAGNYGAGEVIVWDRGTYKLLEGTDPAEEIAKGKITFFLDGKKLKGKFTLVKMRGSGEGREQWLLIKDRDEYVDSDYDPEKDPVSAKSGRTLEEIAKNPGVRDGYRALTAAPESGGGAAITALNGGAVISPVLKSPSSTTRSMA